MAPFDLFVFSHDPGNNWRKSQLLCVLSERGLRSDKAAQVLAAEGMYHLRPGSCQTERQGQAALLGCGGSILAWKAAGIRPGLPVPVAEFCIFLSAGHAGRSFDFL